MRQGLCTAFAAAGVLLLSAVPAAAIHKNNSSPNHVQNNNGPSHVHNNVHNNVRNNNNVHNNNHVNNSSNNKNYNTNNNTNKNYNTNYNNNTNKNYNTNNNTNNNSNSNKNTNNNQSNAAANSDASSNASSNASSSGNSGGNSNVSVTTEAAASSAAPVYLTTSNDTCMGSTGLGAQGMSWGFSIGTTWTDSNCIMLKNARELKIMGHDRAAKARLCMDSDIALSFELAGDPCPRALQSSRDAFAKVDTWERGKDAPQTAQTRWTLSTESTQSNLWDEVFNPGL